MKLKTGLGTFYTIQGAFHHRRSNLGSAEPGSTLIIDLNQVQVMMCSTNVKLGSADVVQLRLHVLDADWSDLIEISDVTRTVYSQLSTMFFLALIF